MPTLDRAKQLTLLQQLAAIYPRSATFRAGPDEDEDQFLANLYYLSEHQLVSAKWLALMDGRRHPGAVAITAAGMDFLADDGGLSAILGIVTVRLHDETIRKLLIDKIEKATGDPSMKQKIVEKIKGLPAEALGAIAMAGLDAGLSHTPDVLGLVSRAIGL